MKQMIKHHVRWCVVATMVLFAAAQLEPDPDPAPEPEQNYCSTHRCIPNYDILGTGIDAVSGKATKPIVSLAFTTDKNVTIGSFGKFSVPDHVGACLLGTTNIVSNAITSTEEMSRVIAADMGILADDLTPSYFSQWNRFKEYADRANRDWLFTTRWSRLLFQIDLSLSGLNRLNPLFMRDVTKLPMTYHGNERAYQQFLKIWGTHIVTDMVYGGYLELVNYLEGCSAGRIGTRYVTCYLRAKFDQVAAVHDIAIPLGWYNMESQYQQSKLRAVGGSSTCTINKCSWDQYLQSIDIGNIGVIQQKVMPISWVLGQESRIATNLDRALKDYLFQNMPEVNERPACALGSVVKDKSWKIWGLVAIGIIVVLSILLAVLMYRYATKVHDRDRGQYEERQRLVVPVSRVERYDSNVPAPERVVEPPIVERP